MKKIYLLFLIAFAFIGWRQPGDWLVLNLKGYWKFHIGDNPEFADPYLDDSRWDEIFVPSPWENENYHGYDGYAWYRVKFELKDATIENESLYLELGYIDDVDEVYINGEKIGFTGAFPPHFHTAYNSRRIYYLPGHLLKKGQPNTIAVRVFDTVLDGGIVGGTIGIFSSRDRLPAYQRLEGLWKLHEYRNADWRKLSYEDEYWEDVMVPGFWRSMKGKRPKTNIATYRKEFKLAEYLDTNEDLVVVLGKIDDFDEVYLNGALIGKTKDYRPLGSSVSWQTLRVYDLPYDLLDKRGANILTVEIEDIGGNAGIYEGPILITYASEFRRIIRQLSDHNRW